MRAIIKQLSVVSALALAACTGSSQNVKVGGPEVRADNQKSGGDQQQGAKDGKAPPPAEAQLPVVSTRSKLYFDDALKELQKAKETGKWDYSSLESKFQKAADEDPRLAEAYYNLGVLAERQRKTDVAITNYNLALKSRPSLKQAAENLAVIQQNKGDISGAVEIYMKILEVYPDDGPARARLAEIYRQNGEYDRAIDFAREALVRDPKSLQAYKVLMLANLDRKQLSMAKLVALRALKIDESDPELYHTIGLILLQENEPGKARLQFQKAAEVRPDYQPAQVMLAKIALQSEDYVGAEEHLRRILQADGKNAAAMVDLGVAYKGQGQYDKAMQAYDAAEKVNPKLASIQFNRGVIIGDQKKEYAKAIEYFKKFVAMENENALPVDHPVFQQIRLNEERIAKAEADARAAEEAKAAEAEALKEAARMEAEMKAAEDAAKQAEKDAKNGGKGDGKGEVKPASGKEEPAVKPAVEKKEEKKEEKKKEPARTPVVEEKKLTVPAKSDEPTDEPSDGL